MEVDSPSGVGAFPDQVKRFQYSIGPVLLQCCEVFRIFGINLAYDGMVDRSAPFRKKLDVDHDEPDAVLHKTDIYAEVVLASAWPPARWRLSRGTTHEVEIVVGLTEDDFIHQRPEAVKSHFRTA